MTNSNVSILIHYFEQKLLFDMGSVCNSHPNDNELPSKPSKAGEPRPPTPPHNHTTTAPPTKTQDAPNKDFATAVDSVPQLSSAAIARQRQLPPYYENPDGHDASSEFGTLIKTPYKLKNGTVYVGEWKDGNINGYGKYYLPDGSVLEALSVKNVPQEYVRVIYANGDYYDGYQDGQQANGQGKYVEKDVVYEGWFSDNVPHGKGKETSPNSVFTGEFWKGQKENGNFKYQVDGKDYEYDGEFSGNLFNGGGTLTTPKGQYIGEFVNGKKSGKGTFTWHDGTHFVGSYLNDHKNGEGILYDKNRNILRAGKWENDKQV